MKLITFSRDTREAVQAAQHFTSKIGNDPIEEFHHLVPNTLPNQKKWPIFLQSPFNCVGITHAEHDSSKIYTELRKITDKEADVYEAFLQKLLDSKRKV